MDPTPPDDRSRRALAAGRRRTGLRSNRFLTPEECGPAQRRPRGAGGEPIFAEGHWPAIRVVLERQGWSTRQIELVHDQLLQGWPLELAKEHVGVISGQCPLHAQRSC